MASRSCAPGPSTTRAVADAMSSSPRTPPNGWRRGWRGVQPLLRPLVDDPAGPRLLSPRNARQGHRGTGGSGADASVGRDDPGGRPVEDRKARLEGGDPLRANAERPAGLLAP